MSNNRKMSKVSIGGARLISVKDGGQWCGTVWVKGVKSLKEFDALMDNEQGQAIMEKCPREVRYQMNFPTEYIYVRSECKEPEGECSNCPFLFRQADGQMYDCRYYKKTVARLVYEDGTEIGTMTGEDM